MPKLPLIGPTYALNSGSDCQRTVNLYPEAVESGDGKNRMALIGTPGLSLFVTLPSGGPVRTLITCFGVNTAGTDISNGLPRVFAIAGPVGQNCKLYELFTGGTATERGTLVCNSDEGPFSVAYSNTEMLIAHGTNHPWLFRFGSGAFVQLDAIHQTPATADPELNLYQVVYKDGYFVGIVGGTQQLRISALGNGFSWDALDIAEANAKPDILTGIIEDGKELWLFGQNSTQPFWDSGNADFPFEPSGNQIIEIGCGAVWSIAKLDEAKFWVSHDSQGRGMVMRVDGYSARRISNHAVEQALRSYANLHKAIGFTYQDEGHGFYFLYVPGAPVSWVYDVATELWHERMYRNPTTGVEEAHRACCHCFAFWESTPFKGKHLVGDRENGNIYVMDPAVYTDNTAPIRRIRRTPHLTNDGKRVKYTNLKLHHLPGTALVSGQGSDPLVALRFSNDGGQTWSQEFQRRLGAVGETRVVPHWPRLGSAYDRAFELSTTEPIKHVWHDATVDYEVCAS